MTTTANVTSSGNPYIDGVLSGVRWGVNTLTYSFPTNASYYGANYGSGEPQNGFEAFNATQQAAVKSALQMYSAVANLSFSQVTESASSHGELRYAESNLPGTAYAYYPSTAAIGGDLWFNHSSGQYDSPAKGNYAWTTVIHETGHAVGLKHPHEASGSFGAMPVDHDSLEYSVMSYRSYVGASTTTGYVNGSTSFPQTLMMYDIAAVQKMYGANYATNSGDTTYRWDANTGEMSVNGVATGKPAGNKVFMTLWDGGGVDTYDLSNYSGGVKVDLNPGGWTTTSATQLADLGGGHKAVGNIAGALLYNGNPASLIENAIGGAGGDLIIGNAANNTITGGRGNDTMDGGAGADTAVFSGASTNYLMVKNATDGSYTVTDTRATNGDGVDIIRNIEQLKFSDKTIAINSTYTGTTVTGGGTVTGTQTAVNQAPVANADNYTMNANSTATASVNVGVLKNDTDANGDRLTAVLASGPSKGKLTLNSDGSFTYKAPSGYNGTVSFTYQASDGKQKSAAATVTIKVGVSAGKAAHSAIEDQAPGLASTPLTAVHNSKGGISASVLALHASVVHGNDTASDLQSFQPHDHHDFSFAFHGDAGLGHADLAGLPDFMSAAYSEFMLA